MNKLTTAQYPQAMELAEQLEHHLALKALLCGDSPGEVYLDDRASPRSLFARTMKRCFLAGQSDSQEFNQRLKQLFAEEIFPRGVGRGEQGFSLFYAPEAWGEVIAGNILEEIYPRDLHHYYRCRKLIGNWREIMPPGYELIEVNQALVEKKELLLHEDLIEEIHSECSSTAEFLANRFGFCVLAGEEIITWCLSEYNSGGGCEVGIATQPGHRRQGLATLASLALVEKAFELGYQEVGWHCYAGNQGSIAAALSAGFELEDRYPAYWVSYDRAIALAIMGNQQFDLSAYQAAVEWYLRSIAEGSPPDWVYWITACSYAHLDQREAAFDYLHQAIDHGFDDAEHIKNSPHFEKWHESENWESVVKRL